MNDHLQFVIQTIEICRETLSSLVDLYISNNGPTHERHYETTHGRFDHLHPAHFSCRRMGNELQNNARTRMAIWLLLCMGTHDYAGNYYVTCILRKKDTKSYFQIYFRTFAVR